MFYYGISALFFLLPFFEVTVGQALLIMLKFCHCGPPDPAGGRGGVACPMNALEAAGVPTGSKKTWKYPGASCLHLIIGQSYVEGSNGRQTTQSPSSWLSMHPQLLFVSGCAWDLSNRLRTFLSSREDWEAKESICQSKWGGTETGDQLITFKGSFCTDRVRVHLLA